MEPVETGKRGIIMSEIIQHNVFCKLKRIFKDGRGMRNNFLLSDRALLNSVLCVFSPIAPKGIADCPKGYSA